MSIVSYSLGTTVAATVFLLTLARTVRNVLEVRRLGMSQGVTYILLRDGVYPLAKLYLL